MLAIYIITPAYNVAQYINDAITSVVKQAEWNPIVYHVQDGGSTDGTISILNAWKEKLQNHPNIIFTFTSKKDNGMYDAIAKAVARLNIPEDAFMGWINADDLLAEKCLLHLKQASEQLLQFNWFGGYHHIQNMQGNLLMNESFCGCYPQALLQAGLCDGSHWYFIQQEGTFWRKKLWDKAGGLDTSLRLAGDWDLWRRMAMHEEYIALPASMGIFRKRQGQLSQDLTKYTMEINKTVAPILRNTAGLKIGLGLKKASYTQVTRSTENIFLTQHINFTPRLREKVWLISPVIARFAQKIWQFFKKLVNKK